MQPGLALCLGLALSLGSTQLPPRTPQQRPAISEDEIKEYFGEKTGCGDDVNIDNLEYFDFTGDGDEEAVVVASTCATGTAGSDVHSVVRRDRGTSLAELRIPELTKKQGTVLFCRCFYDLSVEDGLLVETYHDQSDRTDPLVLKLRWDSQAKEFRVAEVKKAPSYKTSFDCDKAKTSIENAICYSSTVAALDVGVDRAYKKWLNTLNNTDSDILMKEQKAWLHERDQLCGQDLDILNCLEVVYKERGLELANFRHLHPPAPVP